MTEWLRKAITPPLKSQATFDSYKRIIESQIGPKLGGIRLQALKPIDIEACCGDLSDLSPSTVHAILHSALKAAVRNGLVTRNVAALVSNKPRKRSGQDVLDHVWSADEANKFLKAANAPVRNRLPSTRWPSTRARAVASWQPCAGLMRTLRQAS
jgi:hypothetical protein